jgi:hypothetical protein
MLVTVMFHLWNRIYTIETCYFGYNMWCLKTFRLASYYQFWPLDSKHLLLSVMFVNNSIYAVNVMA